MNASQEIVHLRDGPCRDDEARNVRCNECYHACEENQGVVGSVGHESVSMSFVSGCHPLSSLLLLVRVVIGDCLLSYTRAYGFVSIISALPGVSGSWKLVGNISMDWIARRSDLNRQLASCGS